jgi:uncharacterized UBP type Zn finger protein
MVEYQLYAVIQHTGNTMGSGHYIAYVKVGTFTHLVHKTIIILCYSMIEYTIV